MPSAHLRGRHHVPVDYQLFVQQPRRLPELSVCGRLLGDLDMRLPPDVRLRSLPPGGRGARHRRRVRQRLHSTQRGLEPGLRLLWCRRWNCACDGARCRVCRQPHEHKRCPAHRLRPRRWVPDGTGAHVARYCRALDACRRPCGRRRPHAAGLVIWASRRRSPPMAWYLEGVPRDGSGKACGTPL